MHIYIYLLRPLPRAYRFPIPILLNRKNANRFFDIGSVYYSKSYLLFIYGNLDNMVSFYRLFGLPHPFLSHRALFLLVSLVLVENDKTKRTK